MSTESFSRVVWMLAPRPFAVATREDSNGRASLDLLPDNHQTKPEPYMTTTNVARNDATHDAPFCTAGAKAAHHGVLPETHPEGNATSSSGEAGAAPVEKSAASSNSLLPRSKAVDRGLTASVSTAKLRQAHRLRALQLFQRFRVIRTIDVAVACFPERPFKAALTAAQRVVRSLVKGEFVRRYKTERLQTVYGLTTRGADWLDDHGVSAPASIRRVGEMTNPEHLLWIQFITLCFAARGMEAHTESELLQVLSRPVEAKGRLQGLLSVSHASSGRRNTRLLRPDVLAYEDDGVTWVEIDRSRRGSERDASLAALFRAIGSELTTGDVLRRVVVQARSESIEKRALAIVRKLAAANNPHLLVWGRRHFRPTGQPGTFEVWGGVDRKGADGRVATVDALLGYVVVQLLPTWLPKTRLGAGVTRTGGWFDDGSLPYRRPSGERPWEGPLPLTQHSVAGSLAGA